MMGCSPAQAAFGRGMLFDVPHAVDWEAQQERKQGQVAKATARENAGRNTHEYAPGDLVMVSNNDPRRAKLEPTYTGPYEVEAVSSNGTVVVNKKKYLETLHIRRLRPAPPEMGGSVVK